MKKTFKPKVQREAGDPLGMRLNMGMPVQMSDGWRGKVEQDCGDFVVCLRDGARPDAHWSGAGYRLISRRSMTINGEKVTFDWRSTATASRPNADRERRQRDVVVYLERARLEREWKSAPD
jgi:hypothetical protein